MLEHCSSPIRGTLELFLCPFYFICQGSTGILGESNILGIRFIEPAETEPLKELIETMESQGQIA